jgi:chaperonin cofactor prefoldin
MKTFKELYEACCAACEKREENMEESDSGLAAKADKSGVSIGTLRKVYKRGVAAWNSGHRPGTTPQQWGMARVNSYITKGKGTYHGADKDLREAIQWTKPKNDEHNEVHTQLDAVKRGAEYPDHVHKMLKHLSNKSNFQGAMKNAKPMTITHKDTQPGGKHAEMSNTEATESKPKLGGLDQTKVRRVKKIFNNAMKHGKPMERPIVLHDTHTGHAHLLAGNTRLTHNTHYGSGSTVVHAITYDSSKMHEEVAKDKESGLPKKYVSGLSPSTAKARAAHWDKMDKLSDKDPAAYEPAPGDATAKTKESKHTKKYREMFGEACWTGYKRVGMKKKGDKMVPNCVPANEESDRKPSLTDTLAKIKHDFSTPPADHKDAKPSKPTLATKPKTGGGMPYYPKAAPGKRDLGDSVEMNGDMISEGTFTGIGKMMMKRKLKKGMGSDMEKASDAYFSGEHDDDVSKFMGHMANRRRKEKALKRLGGKVEENVEMNGETIAESNEENARAKVREMHSQILKKGYKYIGSEQRSVGKDDSLVTHNYLSKDGSHIHHMQYSPYTMTGKGGPHIFHKKTKFNAKLHDHLTEQCFNYFDEASPKAGKNVVPPTVGALATGGIVKEEENENKPLGKVMRAGDGKKKFKVFVKNAKGNTVKVGFGDPNMEIKRDDPERRKNFRARHNCDTATDRTTPRYWSCRQWRSSAKVEA